MDLLIVEHAAEREAYAALGLDHPGILSFADIGWHLPSGMAARDALLARRVLALCAAPGRVLIATRPDRIGEFQAWNLATALSGEPALSCHRVRLDRVSEAALRLAIDHAEPLSGIPPVRIDSLAGSRNVAEVGAYLAAREIDATINHRVLPLLAPKPLPRALHIGHFGIAALLLLVEREHQVRLARSTIAYDVELRLDGYCARWSSEHDVRPGTDPVLLAHRAARCRSVTLARHRSVEKADGAVPADWFVDWIVRAESAHGMEPAYVFGLALDLYSWGACPYPFAPWPAQPEPFPVDPSADAPASTALSMNHLRLLALLPERHAEATRPVAQAASTVYELDGSYEATRFTYLVVGPSQGEALQVGTRFSVHDAHIRRRTAAPAGRLRPATLIASLSGLGVRADRSACRAIDSLFEAGFIAREGQFLKPSPRGLQLAFRLREETPLLAHLDFIAATQAMFESVATGQLAWRDAVTRCAPAFQPLLRNVSFEQAPDALGAFSSGRATATR